MNTHSNRQLDNQSQHEQDELAASWPDAIASPVREVLDDHPLDANTLMRLADARALAVQHLQTGASAKRRFAWAFALPVFALTLGFSALWVQNMQRSQQAVLADVAQTEALFNFDSQEDVNDNESQSLRSEQAELEFLGWLAHEPTCVGCLSEANQERPLPKR
jgi:hypothetical protein